jgi:Uma2 family endonuclease
MTDRIRETATYADLEQVPENMVAELIDGDLYAWPRPSGPHTVAASRLGADILIAYDRGRRGPDGWWILDEPELHLDAQVIVPDIAGWRRERLPGIPRNQVFSIPPDWICEVLSPSTAHVDMKQKMPIFAAHGVSWAWIVDPERRTLRANQLVGGSWVVVAVFHDGAKVIAEPFPEVEIDLAWIWDLPLPPP